MNLAKKFFSMKRFQISFSYRYWTAFSCSNLISNCLYCGLRMDVLDSLKLTLDVEAWVLFGCCGIWVCLF